MKMTNKIRENLNENVLSKNKCLDAIFHEAVSKFVAAACMPVANSPDCNMHWKAKYM